MKRYSINNGNELISGKVRYINLADISTSSNVKNLAIDSDGNLGVITTGSGAEGIKSVTGDLVDNTDPANPIIDLPTDVLKLSDVSSTPEIDKIPIYLGSGIIRVTDGTSSTDAVNKGQLDNKLSVPTGTASATTFACGDGTWKTPTNTTYTVISEAEATTGTATTARAVSPQSQKRDILNRTRKYDNFTGVNSNITLAKIHADRNIPILCTGGSPLTFTIPAVATGAWEVGDVIEIYNNHGAILTITAGAGVNLNSVDGLVTVDASGWAKLVYLTTNQWQLIGSLINPA